MDDRLTAPEHEPTNDVEAHRLATNDNETVFDDEPDVEAHRLATNDNETVVED